MPVFGIIVKKPAVEWASYYDNTDFEGGYLGTWNVDRWDAEEDRGDYILFIDVIGDWYEGYRPTSVRVTFTGGATLSVFSEGGMTAIIDGSYTSGEEITLDWTDDVDLSSIFFGDYPAGSPFSITNIEWFGGTPGPLPPGQWESAGTPSVWNADHGESNSSIMIDSTHAMVSYGDSDDNDAGKSVIATIDGTSITWGSEYEFHDDIGYEGNTSSVMIDSTHVLVTYVDGNSPWYGHAKIGTISSGDEISWGSAQVFNSGTCGDIYCCMLDSTHVLITYRDSSNSHYGTAIIGVISGSTVTWGSKYTYNTGGGTYGNYCTKLDSTHFAVVFRESPNWYGEAIVGVVSNGDEIAFGNAETFRGASTNLSPITAINSTSFFIGFAIPSDEGLSTIATVSNGDEISFGSSYSYNGTDWGAMSNPILIDSSHVLLVYQDYGNSQKGACKLATISNDDEIAYGDKFTWNDNGTFRISAVGLDSTHVMAFYNTGDFPDNGTAIIIY